MTSNGSGEVERHGMRDHFFGTVNRSSRAYRQPSRAVPLVGQALGEASGVTFKAKNGGKQSSAAAQQARRAA